MSRTRIVGGNITRITGGNYKVYSNENIEIHSGGKIIQTGKENGVSFGVPKNPPEIEIKPKKIKFRPSKIAFSNNIISVVEKMDDILKEGDIISISGNEIKDKWININGKLYLIPKNISLYGTSFFKVNNEIYQTVEQISNCVTFQDYENSIDEQMQILKEFIIDIESTDLKFKNQIKDRLSYDGYFRFIECIQEIESLFSESPDSENVKKWLINKLEN